MHAKIITTEVQSKRSITSSSAIICRQIGNHPNSFTPRRARKAAARRNARVDGGATGLWLYFTPIGSQWRLLMLSESRQWTSFRSWVAASPIQLASNVLSRFSA